MTPGFLVFGAPDIADAEMAEVIATMRSGWLGTGPKVAAFEAQFAAFKGVPGAHAVAVNSCTAALHLSLLAAGVGPGDEVITSAMTFCATVNAILHTGATAVLADIDPRTLNIDVQRLERHITPKTKALLPVHFAGLPCDMGAMVEIAARHRLIIIEDCAHAVEASYQGRPTGTLGDYGCFSFHATKNVTTGEGGMVVVRDPERALAVRAMAMHGMSQDAWARYSDQGFRHYDVVACGFKYNMMDLQAAIGIHQLGRVEEGWKKRSAIWRRYQQAFAGLPVTCPDEPLPGVRHGLHLYALRIDEQRCGVSRDLFLQRMTASGIGVGVHYQALAQHTYYRQHLGWQAQDTPHAALLGLQTVSLPLGPKLSDGDVDRVIESVGLALA